MRVRATAFGEYRGKRKPGTEFEFEGKPSAKWMEPVDDVARKAFKDAGIKVAPKPAAPKVVTSPPPAAGANEKDASADPGAPPAAGGSTGDKNVI